MARKLCNERIWHQIISQMLIQKLQTSPFQQEAEFFKTLPPLQPTTKTPTKFDIQMDKSHFYANHTLANVFTLYTHTIFVDISETANLKEQNNKENEQNQNFYIPISLFLFLSPLP